MKKENEGVLLIRLPEEFTPKYRSIVPISDHKYMTIHLNGEVRLHNALENDEHNRDPQD